MTKDTVVGFNFLTVPFVDNNDSDMSIQDIKLDNGTDYYDNIQILDEGGATIETYTYVSGKESGLEKDGWLNENSELADKTFSGGDGFLVYIENEGTVITIPCAL